MAALFFDLEILYRLYRYGNRHHVGSRRKIGPKGKFRPFILYASFRSPYWRSPTLSAHRLMSPVNGDGHYSVYALRTVFQHDELSYGAMVPAITKNPNERASLAHGVRAALRWACCCARWDSCRYESYRGESATWLYLRRHAVSLFGLLFMWICYSGVKERYVKPNLLIRRKSLACCNLSAQCR